MKITVSSRPSSGLGAHLFAKLQLREAPHGRATPPRTCDEAEKEQDSQTDPLYGFLPPRCPVSIDGGFSLPDAGNKADT